MYGQNLLMGMCVCCTYVRTYMHTYMHTVQLSHNHMITTDSPGYLISIFNTDYDFKTMFHMLRNCMWQRGLFKWGRFTIIALCIQQLAQVRITAIIVCS